MHLKNIRFNGGYFFLRKTCALTESYPLARPDFQIIKARRDGPEKLGIDGLLDMMLVHYNQAKQLQRVIRKSVLTEQIQKAGRERRRLFRALYQALKTSRVLPLKEERDAARRLFVLFAGYRGSALGSSISEESSAIDSLLQELRGKYAADVALLKIENWVNGLEDAETNFKDSYKERAQKDVERPVGQLRKIRIRTDAIYKNITNVLHARLLEDRLDGRTVADPEEADDPVYKFVIDWNESVKEYRDMIATRAGRRRAKEQTPPPPLS
jgi:hypothetical protein